MITNFGFTNNMENCIIPTILPMVSNKIELANPFEKNIIICLFGCATNEKYKNQIHNINETWIKKAKERNIITLFFLGEEQTDLVGENYIYLKGVGNDYLSASYKQDLGLKYIYENYNDIEFVFVAGTDVYINIDNLLTNISSLNHEKNLYIGNLYCSPRQRTVKDTDFYFHDGGVGFILSKSLLHNLYPRLQTMQNIWYDLIISDIPSYIYACDVKIAYFIHNYVKDFEIKYLKFENCYDYGNYNFNIMDYISYTDTVPMGITEKVIDFMNNFEYIYNLNIDKYISHYNKPSISNYTINNTNTNNNLKFYYGIPNCLIDVSNKVLENCIKDNEIIINQSYNSLFGDPIEGIVKYLFIVYIEFNYVNEINYITNMEYINEDGIVNITLYID